MQEGSSRRSRERAAAERVSVWKSLVGLASPHHDESLRFEDRSGEEFQTTDLRGMTNGHGREVKAICEHRHGGTC